MNNFRIIRHDSRNFILEERRQGKQPDHLGGAIVWSWQVVGYYGKLEHMATRLLMMALEGTLQGDEDMIEAIRKLTAASYKAVNELKAHLATLEIKNPSRPSEPT